MSEQPSAASLPPVQWLRTFLAVMQAGSFSEAALRLHMTQAAVSRHIRLLEHSLGAALFDRHARGVTPTRLAETMLPSNPRLLLDCCASVRSRSGNAGQRIAVNRCSPRARW